MRAVVARYVVATAFQDCLLNVDVARVPFIMSGCGVRGRGLRPPSVALGQSLNVGNFLHLPMRQAQWCHLILTTISLHRNHRLPDGYRSLDLGDLDHAALLQKTYSIKHFGIAPCVGSLGKKSASKAEA